MPAITATGLVIKQSEYGESNCMISVFTKEYGIISAAVYGAKSMKNSKGASCRLLSLAELELSRGNSGIYTVCAAEQKESFYPICEDIEKLSLAVYLCELTYSVLGRENRDDDALSLLLNTLYALAYKGLSPKSAKYVFELRLMSIVGYRPVLTRCVRCSGTEKITAFSAHDGGCVCRKCLKNDMPISRSGAEALRYIISADPKKIYSFSVSEAVSSEIEKICEEYARVHSDTELSSLTYLKKILI